jgi:type II secretory pathway component PulC
MKKFNFNFKFLDRFRKSKDSTPEEDEVTVESDSYSEEDPEDFAEKTLSNFNLEKFQEQYKNHETDNDNNDVTDPNVSFQEMTPPEKPEEAKKFRMSFPKFGNAGKDLRSRLSENSPMERVSWNDFVLRLFSPYSRGKIHGLFIILLVVTFTYLTGKGIALFIGRSAPMVAGVKSNIQIPAGKPDTSAQDISKISATNLFNIKESDKVEDKKPQIDIGSIICLDAQKLSTQPLKLLDTIVLQDSVKSVASVQVRGASDLMNVREGEQLNPVTEVSKINRMRLILKNLETGECEYIANEEAEETPAPAMQILTPKQGRALFKSNDPSIKNTGNTFKIKRQFRDQLMGNMSEILTQAKAVQITNPDGSLCFKMTEVVAGSVYSKLNIQNDDVICNINGKKIENLNELMGLLGKIKEIDQFQIGLRRNGMNENLDYGFE